MVIARESRSIECADPGRSQRKVMLLLWPPRLHCLGSDPHQLPVTKCRRILT